MIGLTIFLNKEVGEAVKTDTEKRVTDALRNIFKKGVEVRVSAVLTNKAAELLFTDMSPVDIDEIEDIVAAAVDALIFSMNSLNGRKIGVTIHSTIVCEVEGEIL